MNEPKSRIPDELLSAYLDGELSPAEQEWVDHALADDQGLQALLTELRQIRADLQRLPQHTLPPSFSDRVLQSCNKQDVNGSAVPPISVRARPRRLVAALLAIAATVMIAAWAADRARWGGAVRQVATNNGPAVIADRADLDVSPSRDLAEAEADVRSSLAGGRLEKKATTASPSRESADTDSERLVDLKAGATVSSRLGRRRNINPSESAAAVEQPSEVDAVALLARVELTFPLDKIEQIKALLQGPQTELLGLKVTDRLITRKEMPSLVSTPQSAAPQKEESEESNEELFSFRGRGETLELQDADTDRAVRRYALLYDVENVQPVELLLLEGTQDQIVAAIRQLDVVSTNISDLTAKQLVFDAPAGGSGGLGVLGGRQRSIEQSARGDRPEGHGLAIDQGRAAPISQQTTNKPVGEDSPLAIVADESKSKDDATTNSTDNAAAVPPDQTKTQSYFGNGASAPARAKDTTAFGDQRNRERQNLTNATPRYQVLLVLLREQSK